MTYPFSSSNLSPSPPQEAFVFPPAGARRVLQPPETLARRKGCSEDGAATSIAANSTLLMARLTAGPFRLARLSASPLSRLLAVEPRFRMDAWARVR